MYLKQLIQSGKTIFSIEDLGKIWLISDKKYLRLLASRLFKRGELIRLSRGIYAINKQYNRFELANKLKTPSYVSLETVLSKEGIIFQDYGNTVFSVSQNSLTKKISGWNFQYSKISDKMLSNPLGILNDGQACVATAERAVCDRVYLSPKYYFDNLRGLGAERLLRISKIYNKRVQKEINFLIKEMEKQ